MRLRSRILGTVLSIVVVAVLVTLFAMRYDAPCAAAPPLPSGTPVMKAVLRRCYGPADVISIEEVAKPSPADGQVLVKVRAVSINALDSHVLHGDPYVVMRFAGGIGSPRSASLGVDFAGTVEAVGKGVTDFKPGDEVFGGSGRSAAFAEYVKVYAGAAIAPKPTNVTFEQAAAVPIAALTALQALRDAGHVRAGQKVLVNGASGGVGTFAVQIAKALGAEVTGVCSTRNVEMAREIGADHVVDYTREDFTQSGERYDLILDIAASHSLAEYRRVLKPDGVYVIVGAAGRGRWLGPLAPALKTLVYARFVSEQFLFFVASLNKDDLLLVAELMKAGKVKPVVDRTYASSEIREAFRYFDEGHARGKVVVTFD
jgi:NADPH:quinone reductase-like Zn-dependent oxidoreductase